MPGMIGSMVAISTGDAAVVVLVVGARFLVPLLIPRFPLPAIVTALVLDAADQSIFQQLTDLDLTGYQSYDKALDIYYLSIAYLSVIRNWPQRYSLHVAMFLWYYRLVGVTLFELTGERWILLVFPNTFEYWFIAIEVVRTRFDPRRLSHRHIVLTAAFIWIFVKLPQEWWIHVAQLDFTDFVKEDILGVPSDTPWGEAFAENLWAVAVLIGLAVGAVFAWRAVSRRLPPADWPTTLAADRVNSHIGWRPVPGFTPDLAFFGRELLEKIVLVGLVSVIFFRVFPSADARNWQVFAVAALTVVVNAAFSAWRERLGHDRRSIGAQWVATVLTNFGAMWFFAGLFAGDIGSVTLRDVSLFAILIAVIVTMYDSYTHRRAACLGDPTVSASAAHAGR